MGFSIKQVGLTFTFLAALAAAGCGGHNGASSLASTAAPSTGGTAPVTTGTVTPGTGGNTGTTTLPAGPELVSVDYQDRDNDGTVSRADRVTLKFAADLEPVAPGAPVAGEVELAVAGDTFGVGATIEPGASADELDVVLGDSPKLYVSPTFSAAKTHAGSPSGLNLAATATFKGAGADTVQPAASDLDIGGDLAPRFHADASLNEARGAHCSVTLDDGRILVVGGIAGSKKEDLVAEAELYDPMTGVFTKVSDLSGKAGYMWRKSIQVRTFQATAVKLQSGEVLVCGGLGIEKRGFFGLGREKIDVLESAFLFNPTDNTFKRVGDMKYPRHSHTATVLDDGRVLIAGGYNDSFWKQHKTQAPVEVYDPASKKFEKVGKIFSRLKLKAPRMAHTATPIMGGQAVVMAGGSHYEGGGLFGLIKPKLKMNKGGEVVSPAANSSIKTTELVAARARHAALGLPNDDVFVAGGYDLTTGPVAPVEIFDTANNVWSQVGNLKTPRANPKIAMSREWALVIGGHAGYGETGWVEVFNADAGQMAPERFRLRTLRNSCTVEELPNGELIVIGGFNGGTKSYLSLDGQALASCERFISQ